MRNADLRRVELAWGASIAAEWAHFVALGIFAYNAGGTAAVGIAGLVRMLPAAVIAPLAGGFGDRLLTISFRGLRDLRDAPARLGHYSVCVSLRFVDRALEVGAGCLNVTESINHLCRRINLL